jgi:uncharacterized protein with GYD domain
MQTFILLTKLSDDLSAKMKKREDIGNDWMDAVKKKCPDVKFVAHFAILGQYDFIDIYEAPDIATATKVSMISRQFGASYAESLPAIPYKDFLGLVKDL